MASEAASGQLPKIDFSGVGLADSGSPAWTAVRDQVMRAMATVGCFEAVYDRVSPHLRDSLLRMVSQELFPLPREVKIKNSSAKIYGGYMGQIPGFAYESLAITGASDAAGVDNFFSLLWPDGNPRFSETTLSFATKLVELEEMVRRMVWESLRKDGAELLSNDPLLLLRQLDELRDHISRSSEFLEKPRANMPAVNERLVYYRRSHEILSNTKERVSVAEPYSTSNDSHAYDELCMPQGAPEVPYVYSHHIERPRNEYLRRQLDVVPLSSYHSDEFDLQHRKYKLLPERTAPNLITNQGHLGLAQNSGVSPLGIQMFRMKEHNEGRARAAKSKTKEKHPCLAFAGATPFVICSSCFELLKLPHDTTLLMLKKPRRLRCGSCSEVFCIELIGKRLVISSHSPSLAVSKANGSSHAKVNQHDQYKEQTSSKSDVSSISEEHAVVGQVILPTDDNNSSPFTSSPVLMEQESIDLTDPENLKGLSVASNRSEHVEKPDSTDVSAVADSLIQDSLSFLLSSQKDISETGSKKEHSDEEVRIYDDDKFHQSPEQGEEISGIDRSLHDYSSSSLDHNDIEKHQSQMGIEKTNDPLVLNTNLKHTPQIKMSARDERSQVSVNGYLIPDHLVRKAEKKAGSIFPGEYWYDRHAGFWGVMQRPCLGIIPPFIEEFNYPMPENCAGGNTGVILNGRELHRKDLNLLASRGLPFSAGQSYLLDFSGNLFDEVSNEHLGNFGKLAPTVEKMRRGFGMRAPK